MTGTRSLACRPSRPVRARAGSDTWMKASGTERGPLR
eukprot:CAMPEP_0195110496 /NCGR_PEP_ID=MMETSP0448-20130528/92926_1 /TAXON_ID=66468 /ORGANISM="Heterocapsa triquestra, Strain CCMP 448" /LENGTH=36 /DNA_ID= /DNA_START= /DNA_END= /DNA_ORIENTATION=